MRCIAQRNVWLGTVCFVCGVVCFGAASATPPQPPGGHHALHFGGDNQAGYPSLTPTDVIDPGPENGPRLAITVRPNPFRRLTTIQLALPPGRDASLVIYDLAGRRVREFRQEARASGSHEITWDGRDAQGRALPAGAYVYRVEVGAQVLTGKLVLLH